jgi:hypothetical protein
LKSAIEFNLEEYLVASKLCAQSVGMSFLYDVNCAGMPSWSLVVAANVVKKPLAHFMTDTDEPRDQGNLTIK